MTRARDLADSADKDIAGTLAVDGLDISSSSGATLNLKSTDTTGADTELLGQIDFVSSDVSSGSAGTQARIKGVYEDNGDSSGLAFLTGASTGSGTPTISEVMRIRHEGTVGIGTTSIPTGKLAVEGGIYLSGSSNFLRFGADSSTTAGVGIHRPAANTLAFVTSSNERARVTDNGITFNGDTAAANALDDYEEGSWTPIITGSSSAGSCTYSSQLGRYVKIGKQVSCWGQVSSSSTPTGTGNLQVAGLPFSKENTILPWGAETSIAYFFGFSSYGTATDTLRLLGPVSGGTYARFHSFNNRGDTSAPPTPANFVSGANLYFSVTYEVQ